MYIYKINIGPIQALMCLYELLYVVRKRVQKDVEVLVCLLDPSKRNPPAFWHKST